MKSSTFFIFLAIFIAAIAGAVVWSQKFTEKKQDLFDETPVSTEEKIVNATPQENSENINTSVTQEKTMTFKKPAMMLDAQKIYKAILRTTVGDMEITLNAKETPIAVNNFVYLAKQGLYDGTIFHRAIKLFMIQGGDPNGDGTGGPGYRFDDEPFTGEYDRGTVAMANAGPDTNGSQFFIMHADYPLPPNYVIFGKLISGFETLDAIATAPVEANRSGELSKPVTPVVVTKVEIVEE